MPVKLRETEITAKAPTHTSTWRARICKRMKEQGRATKNKHAVMVKKTNKQNKFNNTKKGN